MSDVQNKFVTYVVITFHIMPQYPKKSYHKLNVTKKNN